MNRICVYVTDPEPEIAQETAAALTAAGWPAAPAAEQDLPLLLPGADAVVFGVPYGENPEKYAAHIRNASPAAYRICALRESDPVPNGTGYGTEKAINAVITRPYSVRSITAELEKRGNHRMNSTGGYDQNGQNFGQGGDALGRHFGQNTFAQQQAPGDYAQAPFGTNPMNQYGGQYPQQDQNPYGAPAQGQNPYGAPDQMQNPYGQPMPQGQNPYGQQVPQNPYGAPVQGQNPYGAPDQFQQMPQNPYGQPMPQNPYGQPMPQNPYGAPDQYQQMPQNPYGQPMPQNPYGQPMPQNPYGAPAGFPQGQMPQPEQQKQSAFKQTVIAVNSPKGGVGKTTISKELATAYATMRVNGTPLKVCLVDGNIGFGDVTTMLKIDGTPNIKTWTEDIDAKLKENPDMKPRYVQSKIEEDYLIRHASGLYVLAAPTNHADSLDIGAEEMQCVIENLKACDFDVIIIDTANNSLDYTLVALELAQIVLMVTTLEVAAINDTRRLLMTLREIQFPVDKIRLVINKMPAKSEADINVAEIAKILGADIIEIIPNFPKIRIINNDGTPASLGKENELTAAIRDLAYKAVPGCGVPPAQGKSAQKSGGQKKSLFGGLFGKK